MATHRSHKSRSCRPQRDLSSLPLSRLTFRVCRQSVAHFVTEQASDHWAPPSRLTSAGRRKSWRDGERHCAGIMPTLQRSWSCSSAESLLVRIFAMLMTLVRTSRVTSMMNKSTADESGVISRQALSREHSARLRRAKDLQLMGSAFTSRSRIAGNPVGASPGRRTVLRVTVPLQ